MLARICAAILCLALAACAADQPAADRPATDTSQLPTFFYGVLVDNDIGAINEAAWALGSPERTRNDPVEALRAAVAVEYLAGELNTAPRWQTMSPLTKMNMLEGRGEFRRVLGIRPDAPSQLVVNVEIAALRALMARDTAAAEQILSGPIFTRPPAQTMQVLNNLPYLPAARAATADAEMEEMHEE